MNPLRVGFVSLGCAKNLVDTEHMAGLLRCHGVALAPSPEKADIVVVNTCAFIADARAESRAAVADACERKRTGRCRGVIVAGCLPQRYRRRIAAEFPEVDAWVGLDRLEAVAEAAGRIARGQRPLFAVTARATRLYEPDPWRPRLTGGPYAYVKIAEGCNHRCAFCAIPAIRGSYRSRAVESIVREAARLLEGGARELNLVSQDTTAYGLDRSDGASLPRLLSRLDRLGGQFWIRLLYGHPARLNEELLEAIGVAGKVCRYLDVPMQHSHPDILRAMGRGGAAIRVEALPERLRAALPGVALRTTVLVGFPGETESHVRHLLEYVRHARFDHLGAFIFSPEEGTPAARLSGRVSPAEAEARRAAVMLAQREVVREKARERVGVRETVLLERRALRAPGVWLARSTGQAPEVDGWTRLRAVPSGARPGDFITARCVGFRGYDVLAEACSDKQANR